MEFTVLDISSTLGICALLVLSFNFLLGTMLSTAYKRSIYWKKLPLTIRKIDVNKVHNWTAYLALACILLHPALLLLDKENNFKLADLLVPFRAPKQPAMVAMGVIALYLIFLVIITTQKSIKKLMGFRFWKNIHLISYCTAFLKCLLGIFLDPQLKDRAPDYFDGEKLICELCLLLLLAVTIIRFRYYLKKQRPSEISN